MSTTALLLGSAVFAHYRHLVHRTVILLLLLVLAEVMLAHLRFYGFACPIHRVSVSQMFSLAVRQTLSSLGGHNMSLLPW